MKTILTACPRNCYSSCSFKVQVVNGKIKHFEPHPENKATPEGICLKGLSYFERAHSKDRISHPLKKDEKGNFIKISWDDAVESIAKKLQYFKDNYGTQSILFYEGSGMAGLVNDFSHQFWKLFGGATTTYGNLCWPAGLEAIEKTLGENKHNAPWDIENADLIILWGKNPAETNIHQMVFIEKAQSSGAKLVVIDPRRTPSSEKADYFIQPKPGTDAALALSLCNYLIKENKTDHNFINQYVYGYNEFKASIEACTLEKASEITEIPLGLIKSFAEEIAKASRITNCPGYGLQRYTNGGQTIRAILAINILTGNIGKKGACFHYANLQSYIFDEIKEPYSYYPERNPDPLFRRSISKIKLGKDILESKNPEIKMIWVERGNPLTQNPDFHSVYKAFKKTEFKVVVEQFMTDTSKMADIILPAKNMFEQSDIIGAYWHSYVQLKPKVMDSFKECKPETEIYYLLAQKLGFNEKEIQKYLPLPGDQWIQAYLKKKVAEKKINWDILKENPILHDSFEEIAFSDYIFKTKSGKIEIFSKDINAEWGVNPLPNYDKIRVKQTEEYPLMLLSPNTKNRIHSQFGNLEVIKQFEPYPIAIINHRDAKEREISNGDIISIFNQLGNIQTKTRISYSLKKGCVVYYNGWWNSEGGSPNVLCAAKETDIGHGAAFHNTFIEIKKYNE